MASITVFSVVPGRAQIDGRSSSGTVSSTSSQRHPDRPSCRRARPPRPARWPSILKRVVLRRSSHTQPSPVRSSSCRLAHDVPGSQHRQRVHVGDEVADVVVGRPQHDVLRRARLHDAAAFHDGDVAADLQRFLEVVADEDDGLLQRLSAAAAARPAAWCGSADRAPRTARPSAGSALRWRRRGPARRAAACRPTAHARISSPTGRGRPASAAGRRAPCARPPACRRARGRGRHSPRPCARAAGRTAGTPWRPASGACCRSVAVVARDDVDHLVAVAHQHLPARRRC